MMKKKKSISFPLQIGIAVVLGVLVGTFLGQKGELFGEIGIILIQLLKILATPLLFFAIIDAFLKTQIRFRDFGRLVFISSSNAIVAGLIALGASQFILSFNHPNELPIDMNVMNSGSHQETAISKGLIALKAFLNLFVTEHLFIVIFAAILLGLLGRKYRNSSFTHIIEICLSFIQKILVRLIHWVPLAIFGVICQTVGTYGFSVFPKLALFIILVSVGIIIHLFIYYPLLLKLTGNSPIQFFQRAKAPLVTAFGTGSSLATLPVTLKTLQTELKVSPESARLAACVGTNLNHVGILLYEAATALFIAHIHGIPLNLEQKFVLLASSTLAAVGIAGVPDAGLITLTLVLNALNLPLTYVPLLLTVDWFLGRLRATTNVASDMIVAKLLDKRRRI